MSRRPRSHSDIEFEADLWKRYFERHPHLIQPDPSVPFTPGIPPSPWERVPPPPPRFTLPPRQNLHDDRFRFWSTYVQPGNNNNYVKQPYEPNRPGTFYLPFPGYYERSLAEDVVDNPLPDVTYSASSNLSQSLYPYVSKKPSNRYQ